MDKEFCQKCGNHTLYRISKYVDRTGTVRYNDRLPKRFTTRGKKFPIPKPKLGKHNNDLILTEDQMYQMNGRQHAWNTAGKKVDPLDYDTYQSMCLKNKQTATVHYGH
jgi:RNA-binding protein NOB1